MQKEKELSQRLKHFLDRYYYGHNNNNEGFSDESMLNKKILEIEKELTAPIKINPSNNANDTQKIAHNSDHSGDKKQKNNIDCNKEDKKSKEITTSIENKIGFLSSYLEKPIPNGRKENLITIKKPVVKTHISKTPKKNNKQKFLSQSQREEKPKKKQQPINEATTSTRIDKKEKNERKDRFLKSKLINNKNNENLSHYGINSKKLEKLSKYNYNEDGEKNKKRNNSASNEKESIKDFEEHVKSKSSKEKRVHSSEIFKESTEKVNKMNSKMFSVEFKNEVHELITLIKKEKQVILEDINNLNKQLQKYKNGYNSLKIKLEQHKSISPPKEDISKLFKPLAFNKSTMTQEFIFYEKETMTAVPKDSSKKGSFANQEINTIEKRDKSIECDLVSNLPKPLESDKERKSHFKKDLIRRSGENLEIRESLQSKLRYSVNKKTSEAEIEEYDIYGGMSDKIDEEKIKTIGQLLTTMNMDNKESDYSIIDTLHTLNKDDFLELQHMIIQRLLDNYSIEKNEKEVLEIVLQNKQKEFLEEKSILEDKIKILEKSSRKSKIE